MAMRRAGRRRLAHGWSHGDLTKRERERERVFKYFGVMSAASVVAPADRGGPTVTLGDTEYRAGVKIRGRDSLAESSAAIVVVRQD